MSLIALVTGANKGIGYETARLLRERDVDVYMAARDPGRGKAAADALGARFVQLDVTDADSISAAAKQIDALDILVNNAGIGGGFIRPSDATLDGVREVFETNVFGVIAVTNAMLPLLRRSAAGRIVNVSSEVGSLAFAIDPQNPLWQLNFLAYPASKTALNMVTLQYAKELWHTGIKVNAVTPGYCATDLNNHSGYRTSTQGAQIAVKMALLPQDGPTGVFVDDDGTVPW
jgi:NAD(P)-dependent dehydrogenase (short-subunit alcohol dehydrogenase family)